MVKSGQESPQGPETLPSTCNTLFFRVFLENIEMVNAKMQFREWKGPQGKARAPRRIENVKCTSFKVYGPESTRSFIQNYIFQLKENGLTYSILEVS